MMEKETIVVYGKLQIVLMNIIVLFSISRELQKGRTKVTHNPV
jgi:hypothetical protein